MPKESTSVIHSSRLDLISLTPDALRMMLQGDVSGVAALLGIAEIGLSELPEDVMQLRLHQLETEPDLQPWLLRVMVLREQRICVGHIGFHTAPGAEYLANLSPLGVELGYEVAKDWRRRGIAAEAIKAMMRWASEFRSVNRFILSISPSNSPSLSLAAKLGFKKIGSHIDEIDGHEDIFEKVYLPVDTSEGIREGDIAKSV